MSEILQACLRVIASRCETVALSFRESRITNLTNSAKRNNRQATEIGNRVFYLHE